MSGNGLWSLPADFKRQRAPSAVKRKAPEAAIQRQVVTYLSWALAPPTFFTAIAHGSRGGGKEAWTRGAVWKALGAKAGVPDILIVHQGRALWIELKSDKGTVSEDQKTVHRWLMLAGSVVAVCRSVDDVAGILEVWGVPLQARLSPAERASRNALARPEA